MKWLNENGSLNTAAFDELEANVRAVSDRNKTIDEILRAAKLGRNMEMVFQCGHSGLYFPADYIKNWGRPYGIGLGPSPVSECLDSDYYTPLPQITPDIQSFDQIMHGAVTCGAQVDLDIVDVDAVEFLVLAHEDPYMKRRAAILRAKQDVNPLSRRRIMKLAWDRQKGALQ